MPPQWTSPYILPAAAADFLSLIAEILAVKIAVTPRRDQARNQDERKKSGNAYSRPLQ